MTKENPHARSEIDTSHIIKSKRRSRPVVQYNEDEPKITKPKAQSAIKKKAKPAQSKATSRPKTRKATDKDDDDSDDSDAFSKSSSSEEDSAEEDFSEEEEEEEEKAKKRGRARTTSVKKPAPKRRVLSMTPTSTKRKPITSTNRTIHRINQVAPVTPLRRVNVGSNADATPYALARERLHVSAVPDSLPCREDEFMDIMGYIESAIHEATGTCVYISGVPGTGKTATVLEVIRHLQQQAEEKTIPPFDFVEINGMKLTDPNQAYSILWDCMDRSNNSDGKQRRYTAAHALQLLEQKFSKQSDDQRTTVVLMDELDLLVTKKQTVMYNFFDWPSRPLSKLIVVAVANTMDLPERIMSNKIASRMGLTRINFQPYKYDQLYQIVQSRLEGIDAFAKEAVEFAARKVSAVSGDARRALDICRRAVEIVEARSAENVALKHVTIAIVDQAIKEMFTSPSVAFIRSCSLHQKIFLVACMQRSRAIGLAEIEFGDVAHYHIQTCKWHNIEPPNTSDLMRVCESLSQTRALLMEGGRMDICMRLSLNLVEEDIVMACKADKLISRLLQNLPSAN